MDLRPMEFVTRFAVALCLCVSARAQVITNFGTVTVQPAFDLNGAGDNIDSLAFWEAPDPADTLMFVTGKGNDLLEVWRYPFVTNSLTPQAFPANINGVAVDQESDRLYVSDRIVSVFSLPGLQSLGTFGQHILGVGENNLAILKQTGGRTLVYVSDDHNVHRFDGASTNYVGSFAPPVSSIETVVADDFHQVILVPEEQGPEGNPGVFAFHPDGTPFEMGGTNRFGNNGEFDSDEEGIILYTFPANGAGDDGTGFIVVSDQRSDVTDFEFFDRRSWVHLGRLRIAGVSNTDGIASTQKALPAYPLGLFAAVDNDTSTVGVGWDVIFLAMGYSPYEVWALARGLRWSTDAGVMDDPDGDGCPNIKEFATDGDPRSGLRDRKRHVSVRDMGATNQFVYTFPVRDGAVFTGTGVLTAAVDGVVYTVTGAAALDTFDGSVMEVPPATSADLPPLRTGWTYRSFRLSNPAPETPAGYIRLSAAPAPGHLMLPSSPVR